MRLKSKSILNCYRDIAALVAIFLFSSLAVFGQQAIVTFDGSNSPLPDNAVWDIAAGPDGTIWMGTDWGLASYDGSNWQVYQTTNSGLPNDAIKSLFVEDTNRVWVGTSIGGLALFDQGSWTVYNTSNSGLPSNHVRCMDMDDSGKLYVGTDNGLGMFAQGAWTVWNLPDSGIGSNNIPSILVEGQDSMWLGTINAGLVHRQGNALDVFTLANSGITDNTVLRIVKDSGDDLWLATPANGLIYYYNLLFIPYHRNNSSNPALGHSSVILDQNEVKWASTLDKGLVRYESPDWRNFEVANSDIPEDFIRSLTIDPVSGNIWGGTQNSGVFRLDPNILLSQEGVEAEEWDVFPNPATDLIRWSHDAKSMRLIDLNGSEVLGIEPSLHQVSVGNLPNGLYLLEVKANSKIYFQRLRILHQ